MDQIQFTIPEILSLIGVTQCVYILVYMVMRSGKLSRAGLPILYFTVLALAFLADFGSRTIGAQINHYDYVQWMAWFFGPPLSVLLVLQIAKINQTPPLKYYGVLALIPLALILTVSFSPVDERGAWLTVGGVIAGSLSLLTLTAKRDLLTGITTEKTGKARYWLVLALISMNIFFLATMLTISFTVSPDKIMMIRTVLGLGLAYIAGTSLFRIYPQAVKLSDLNPDKLSSADAEIARKIETLLTREKVYQEPAYSRADLARECGASEAVLSKVINLHFGKTFPQLMNEYRINDAKRLLKETDANVRTVAEEVGFNSLATFNRVFKDMTGSAPGQFRENKAA